MFKAGLEFIENPSTRRMWAGVCGGWDTRIRTRKNRTKTCCVTITPYPNPKAFIAKSGAKVLLFA